MVTGGSWLRLEERGGGWALAGPGSAWFVLVNEYLGYLGDRNYSPKTVRAYGFDLLAFCRWLGGEDIALAAVTTDVLLRLLSACREARVPGRAGGPNVVTLGGRRVDQYAATTVNRRLAAISGLFSFASMRDPGLRNPVPKGREARWAVSGERNADRCGSNSSVTEHPEHDHGPRQPDQTARITRLATEPGP